MIIRTCLLIAAVLVLAIQPAQSKKRRTISGPVIARVVDVYDGDTIEVLAQVWPGQQVEVRVRIRGIDAPEMRARCAIERRAAIDARDSLRRFIAGQPVYLTNIRGGKYFGRVLADVADWSGRDMEAALLKSGLVRPYRGKKRKSWC